jgi:mono/diheme cytochrome c family protein
MKTKFWILLGGLIVFGLMLSACAKAAEPDPKAAKPSNSGGTGKALLLTGDVTKGKDIYVSKCAVCHGDQGAGGVANAGSDDGTVPALNPIDETLANKDPKVFAANLDLFIEHGSTPEGSGPAQIMVGWGDTNQLDAQGIADVIAYIISLNPVK